MGILERICRSHLGPATVPQEVDAPQLEGPPEAFHLIDELAEVVDTVGPWLL